MTIKQRLLKHQRGDILAPMVDAYLRRGTPHIGSQTWAIINELTLRPERDRRRTFSASGLDRCMRQQTMELLGFTKDEVPNERLSNIFFDGNWRHLRWQALFLEMGVVARGRLENGQVVRDPEGSPLLEVGIELPAHMLRGTLDLIADINGELWLVDIKGANPRTFSEVRGGGQPYRAYRLQLQAYMRATGIERALLWYEDKSSQEYHEIKLDVTDVQTATLFDARTQALRHFWERQELPPPLPQAPMNSDCRGCPYQMDCVSATWTLNHLEEVLL